MYIWLISIVPSKGAQIAFSWVALKLGSRGKEIQSVSELFMLG